MSNLNDFRNPLQPLLDRQPFIVLDGALATELERRGAHIADPLWSAKILLDAPHLIRQLHYDYFAAGADIAITASYQASFQGFADRGLAAAQAAEAMRLSIQLAQDARQEFWDEPTCGCDAKMVFSAALAGKEKSCSHVELSVDGEPICGEVRARPLVAVSVGPYGAFRHDGSEYSGDYGLSTQALMDWHRPRLALYAEAIRSGMGDLLACETIPCLREAEALIELLTEFPDLPAWLSFSCHSGAENCRGEPFYQCITLAHASPQVVAVGVNCTPPRFVESLLQIGVDHTDKPLIAYPNRGEIWNARTRSWLPHTAEQFCSRVTGWHHAGARLIGGCCRTRPRDIAQIRQLLQKEMAHLTNVCKSTNIQPEK